MQRQDYYTHLEQSEAEVTQVSSSIQTLHERKAAIIYKEIETYYQAQTAILRSLQFVVVNRLDDLTLECFYLIVEYERLQTLIQQANEKKSTILSRFGAYLSKLNLVSMIGIFIGNVLNALSIISTLIATTATVVATLTLTAFALPISLSTTLISVTMELINAMANPNTPKRKTVIASNLAILGAAGTAFLVPCGIVPSAILGLTVALPVLPLLFTAITAISYFKDIKLLKYKDKLIAKNNETIEDTKHKLKLHMRTFPLDKKIITEDSMIQRLTFQIAEKERENAILSIQCKTLSKTFTLHKISFLAIGIMIASAIIFPPVSIAAFIAGAIGVGILVVTIVHGNRIKKDEKREIAKNEIEMTIGKSQKNSIQEQMDKLTLENRLNQPTPVIHVNKSCSFAKKASSFAFSIYGLFRSDNQQLLEAPTSLLVPGINAAPRLS
jgi:hypothetical protein